MMKLRPQLISCVPDKMFSLDLFDCFLLENIRSAGSIEYLYIFCVFQDRLPMLYYTIEKSVISDENILGVFNENGHVNLGVSAQCDDKISFLSSALNYVCEKYSLNREDIKELPKKQTLAEYEKLSKE